MQRFLQTVVFLTACSGLAGAGLAYSQSWPTRPLRIVVPFPPGNGTDILARLMTPKLTQSLRQAGVVENRGGAHGHIGAAVVAQAIPGRPTTLFTSSSTPVTPPV